MSVEPGDAMTGDQWFDLVPGGSAYMQAAFSCSPECPVCRGVGAVCEEHADRPWGPLVGPEPADGAEVDGFGGCWCGGAGMPCRETNRR